MTFLAKRLTYEIGWFKQYTNTISLSLSLSALIIATLESFQGPLKYFKEREKGMSLENVGNETSVGNTKKPLFDLRWSGIPSSLYLSLSKPRRISTNFNFFNRIKEEYFIDKS